MTTKKCPRCGEVLHWCHDDMYLCNKCNTVCGYEEKVKPTRCQCGGPIDESRFTECPCCGTRYSVLIELFSKGADE